jgi:hypothetical protein
VVETLDSKGGNMAFVSSPISSYKVVLYGTHTPSTLGAFIHCFHGGTNVMSCSFYNDEENVPSNNHTPPHRVNLAYPMSKFDSVLKVLQTEKPLYFGFISTNKLGYVSTNSEPVGEEEG